MTFGQKLQEIRKASGLSQEQLADALGMSRQAVSKWETGESVPDIEKLGALCKIFRVSADELIGNEARPAEKPAEDSRASDPGGRIEEYVDGNMRRRVFTAGWVTALVGAVMLLAEYFSLFLLQDLDRARTGSFHSSPLEYASQSPMPLIFGITVCMILAGAGLAVWSLASKRGERER